MQPRTSAATTLALAGQQHTFQPYRVVEREFGCFANDIGAIIFGKRQQLISGLYHIIALRVEHDFVLARVFLGALDTTRNGIIKVKRALHQSINQSVSQSGSHRITISAQTISVILRRQHCTHLCKCLSVQLGKLFKVKLVPFETCGIAYISTAISQSVLVIPTSLLIIPRSFS
jgi:hypothetical protein